jgi:hypothetical protein
MAMPDVLGFCDRSGIRGSKFLSIYIVLEIVLSEAGKDPF